MKKTVGIVVLNLNQRELVVSFMEELSKQAFKEFTVYLVDNGSDEDQLVGDLSEMYSWFRNIDAGSNTGFAEGNNIGMRAAKEDGHSYIWVVNNDIRLEPDCLKNLVDYMEQAADVGLVGPKIMYESEREKVWFAGGEIHWNTPYPYSVNTHTGEGVLDNGQFEIERQTQFVTGASMFFRTSVFDKVDGFKDSYFAYFEDADLSLRVAKAGFKVTYFPGAKLYHMVGSLSGVTSPRSSYYQIRNSLLFVKEWGPKSSLLLALLNADLIILKNIIKLFIPSKSNFAKAQLKAVYHFMIGRFSGPIEF